MGKFFKELFTGLDWFDKLVIVILCLPFILPIIITIFSGQYLPEVGFQLWNNPQIIGYIAGRIIGVFIIFIIYRAIRSHIKKNKK